MFTIVYHDKNGNFITTSDKSFDNLVQAEAHQRKEQAKANKQQLRYNGVIIRSQNVERVKLMKRFDDCFINLIME